MTSQFIKMTSSSKSLESFFVSLVMFSYWSKFHVNIITGFEVMTIFFYKGLTRNLEIRNVVSGDWEQLGIPFLAQMSPMKCY